MEKLTENLREKKDSIERITKELEQERLRNKEVTEAEIEHIVGEEETAEAVVERIENPTQADTPIDRKKVASTIFDASYDEAVAGLAPEKENPDYLQMADSVDPKEEKIGKAEMSKVERLKIESSPMFNASYEEGDKGLTPDVDNPDYKPMADKLFTFNFNIDPRYNSKQKEKIEAYAESLVQEVGHLKRMSVELGLNINFVINEKQKELDSIAKMARKKKFFGGKDKAMINSLGYGGVPKNNAEIIIGRIRSQS